MNSYIYYLACPYTSKEPNLQHKLWTEEYRFHCANRAAAKLLNDGHFVYSPISHCHPMAIDAKLPGDWAFWQKYCKVSLKWCNRVMVLKIDGWETSTGVQAEIKLAKDMGLEIDYMEPI